MDFDRFSLDLNLFMIDKRKNFFITQIKKMRDLFPPYNIHVQIEESKQNQ